MKRVLILIVLAGCADGYVRKTEYNKDRKSIPEPKPAVYQDMPLSEFLDLRAPTLKSKKNNRKIYTYIGPTGRHCTAVFKDDLLTNYPHCIPTQESNTYDAIRLDAMIEEERQNERREQHRREADRAYYEALKGIAGAASPNSN